MNYNDSVIKPFKKELRQYHDKINGDNPYNLKKIVGRKNIFQQMIKEGKEPEDKLEKTYGILDDNETSDDDVRLIKGTRYRRVTNADGSYSIINETDNFHHITIFRSTNK